MRSNSSTRQPSREISLVSCERKSSVAICRLHNLWLFALFDLTIFPLQYSEGESELAIISPRGVDYFCKLSRLAYWLRRRIRSAAFICLRRQLDVSTLYASRVCMHVVACLLARISARLFEKLFAASYWKAAQ